MAKKTKILFIGTVVLSGLLACGCATTFNPATGCNEAIFINTASETVIGKSAAAQIEQKYKISKDTSSISRLENIGKKVAAASDRRDLEYKFYLIEDKTLNAFTIPGGHVYIYRGLYDRLDDDQLAAVMGHEIGHVAARHIVKKMQASLGYQLLSTVALMAYTNNQDDKKSKQAGYAAYAGATAFNLVQLGYSRKDEYQADELAIKYTTGAGFDPDGMKRALEVLKSDEEKGISVAYILRSHPYIDERINRLKTGNTYSS
ncbi:MAG: M48 family metalloprotease [Candidatus Omnitrophica bacterium]|jgi:predicted Zn-dependent protease|nr:M48 family metalloprotease [Candidatus Omnitrophota bacterium]